MCLFLESEGLKLPSGRELTLQDLVKFCYDLSETDLEVLSTLLKGGPKTIETLSSELGLSKATISRSLSRLLVLGLVERMREQSPGSVGRPKYLYKTSMELIEKKMMRDIERCSEIIKEFIIKVLKSGKLKT